MDAIKKVIDIYRETSKGWLDAGRFAEYAITYHSTAIEGSTLTSLQVTKLIENGITASNKSYTDHLMVTDHYQAIKFIEKHAAIKTKLTPAFISEMASILMKNTGSIVFAAIDSFDISKGEYRKCGVSAGNRVFPSYQKVLPMVKLLCDKLNDDLNTAQTIEEKLKISFRAQFELVSIHPFGDGNGRVSRLLMNYIQLYFDLPMNAVFKQDKIKYIETMETARRSDNLDLYYKFMMAQYQKFLKSEIKHIDNLKKMQ